MRRSTLRKVLLAGVVGAITLSGTAQAHDVGGGGTALQIGVPTPLLGGAAHNHTSAPGAIQVAVSGVGGNFNSGAGALQVAVLGRNDNSGAGAAQVAVLGTNNNTGAGATQVAVACGVNPLPSPPAPPLFGSGNVNGTPGRIQACVAGNSIPL